MKKYVLIAFVASIVAGCSSSSDDSSVKTMPVTKPVSADEQKAASAALANDPKASADAPRGDGQ